MKNKLLIIGGLTLVTAGIVYLLSGCKHKDYDVDDEVNNDNENDYNENDKPENDDEESTVINDNTNKESDSDDVIVINLDESNEKDELSEKVNNVVSISVECRGNFTKEFEEDLVCVINDTIGHDAKLDVSIVDTDDPNDRYMTISLSIIDLDYKENSYARFIRDSIKKNLPNFYLDGPYGNMNGTEDITIFHIDNKDFKAYISVHESVDSTVR